MFCLVKDLDADICVGVFAWSSSCIRISSSSAWFAGIIQSSLLSTKACLSDEYSLNCVYVCQCTSVCVMMFYKAFIIPSLFTTQLSSSGNPGAFPLLPCHPFTKYATLYKNAPLPDINGGGVPALPLSANPASSNL